MGTKHKVFISYHHDNDQKCKEDLLDLNKKHDIFIDASVNTGDINEGLPDEKIRQKIRDEYLKDSTVTIVLVGTETKNRKHIDWEIYSSMFDGTKNKKSGILVIMLPSTECKSFIANHGDDEKKGLYPNQKYWATINSKEEVRRRYPNMPERIIDSLVKNSHISVVQWSKIENDPITLKQLIEFTFRDRQESEYDLSQPMRRKNS